MAATCGAKFAKVILVIFNFIFLCAGLVLIALGIWMLADPTILKPLELVSGAFNSWLLKAAAGLLLAMGILVVLVTIFGLVAAIKENVVMLGIYIALLCIVCAGEIAGGVIAIAYKDAMLLDINNTLYTSLYNKYGSWANGATYYTNGGSSMSCQSTGAAELWDYIQTKFKCCCQGKDGIGLAYDSFNYSIVNTPPNCTVSSNLPKNNTNVPYSCCKYTGDINNIPIPFTAPYDPVNMIGKYDCTTINNVRCSDAMTAFIGKYAPVLIGIGIGFGMLELFGIIFAVCLCQNPSKTF
jgi:hypothetical protein